MKTCLVLCATESHHNFANLKSFVPLVDSVVVFDTGLSEYELHCIKNIFPELIHVQSSFVNFSKLRNDALLFVPSDTTWIIMPDDSWSITGLTKNHLQTFQFYDIIQVSLKFKDIEHKVHRIFKNKESIRFIGSIHEFIPTNGLKVAQINGIHFNDEYPNEARSKKRFLWDIEQLERDVLDPRLTARSYFYLGQYYLLQHDYDNAMHYFIKRMQFNTNPEQEYICLNLMSNIQYKKNNILDTIILLKESALRYPPRAKEAYMNLYRLTKDSIYKKRADSISMGHTQLNVKR